MDTSIRQCTPTELEERAMSGQAEAAMELAMRYRTGTGGVAQDAGEAERWQDRALQLDPEVEIVDDTAGLPTGAEDTQSDPEQEACFSRWHDAYVQGTYDHTESWPLLNEAQNGNPYAAFVLAVRYSSSRSLDDHSEIRPLLENARTVLERRVATARDEDARALLVQVLTKLGHLYADQACGEEGLQKAWTCFNNALELDKNAVEGLQWFCNGPAARMERFVQDPEFLQKLRFRLMAQWAENHGIRQRLDYALQLCRIRQLNEAGDWLQKALDAPDAAEQPDLCVLARYYQSRVRGEHPDLGELKQIAPHNAEACLVLADLAQNDEERLIWYAAGAAGSDSYAGICRHKQENLLKKMEEQQRTAERNASLRAAAAREEAARQEAQAQAEAARQAAEQAARQSQAVRCVQWRAQSQAGTYKDALSSDLLQEAANNNPYAAFTLAGRFLQSRSDDDRARALPLLEQSRSLLETSTAVQGDAYDRQLLLKTLTVLSSVYTAQPRSAGLEKALKCLQQACELDPSFRKKLLQFYEEHGKSLPEFRYNSTALEQLCLSLVREIAAQGGIKEKMHFVLYCLDHNKLVEAQDGLYLALRASDASAHPDLCVIARYYQAFLNNQAPDLDALRKIAPHNSWACLILGNLTQDSIEKAAYYYGGASLPPAAEGEVSMVDRCAQHFKLPVHPDSLPTVDTDSWTQMMQVDRIHKARLVWLDIAWSEQDHSNTSEEDLRREWKEGNPFAAGILGLQALSSGSAEARQEGVQILTDACKTAREALATTNRPGYRTLLARLLPPLGRALAAEGSSPEDLKQAMDYLTRAFHADPSTGDSLLWFYQGPAKRMPMFIQNPQKLRDKTLNLQMELAQAKGITACAALAADCLRGNDNDNACACLKHALETADASEYPQLCAAARFFVQRRQRFDTSTAEVEKAANAGCSLACLMLGDCTSNRKEKLHYYEQGARIKPETEKGFSCAKDCARKLRELRHPTAAGQAADPTFGRGDSASLDWTAPLNDVQRSRFAVRAILYALNAVLAVVFIFFYRVTGISLPFTIAALLLNLWAFITFCLIISSFLGGRTPDAYDNETGKYRALLIKALIVMLIVHIVIGKLI